MAVDVVFHVLSDATLGHSLAERLFVFGDGGDKLAQRVADSLGAFGEFGAGGEDGYGLAFPEALKVLLCILQVCLVGDDDRWA